MNLHLRDATHTREVLSEIEKRLGSPDRTRQSHGAEMLWTMVDGIFTTPHCLTAAVYQQLQSVAQLSHAANGLVSLHLAWTWVSAHNQPTARHHETFLQRWLLAGSAVDAGNRAGWEQWLSDGASADLEPCAALQRQWVQVDALLLHGNPASELASGLSATAFDARDQWLQSLVAQHRLQDATRGAGCGGPKPRL